MADTQQHFDCVVVGLGAMGSATLYHLARRGVRVLGVEQFSLFHNRGSSHGPSRVFRTTYEDPLYVDLSLQALELWRTLEDQSGRSLLHLNGLLAFASQSNERFVSQLATLEEMKLPHQVMDGREAMDRFGAFAFEEGTIAFFAEKNGMLLADEAIRSMHDLARQNGATVVDDTEVRGIEPNGDLVRLVVGDRVVTADRVVVTAGPWFQSLCADLDLPLIVTREQKVYFDVDDPERFQRQRMPVFVEYDTAIYGLPMHSSFGLKVAADHSGESVDPNRVNRTVDPDYIERIAAWVDRWTTSVAARPTDSAVCLYTTTPDKDFIIDHHPQLANVFVAGGFSGHGFKFSILVGDILADLVLNGSTARPIDRFRLARFA